METNKRREYEYKEVITDRKNIYFLLDGYESFGWEQEECVCQKDIYIQYPEKVVIKLKRSCKIMNKMELTRLQRKYEACVSEIEKLEQTKNLRANLYSLTVGIIGMGFLISTIAMITKQPPQMVPGILFLCITAVCCISPIFIYKRMLKRDTEKLNPLIEEKYNIICETCEKGKRLIYKHVKK